MKKIRIHFIDGNKVRKIISSHVPTVGDELRFRDECFYTVKRLVWVYDEPDVNFDRVNIEIERIDA